MHIQNVHIHIGGTALAAAALASIMGFDSAPQPVAAEKRAKAATAAVLAAPRIGEYWKGQGGVLVGIGRGYDGKGDHHLILPTDPRFLGKKRALGTYGVDVTGAASDHDGMANTIAFAKAGSELCQEILQMEVEGHKDLYLMSRADARLCMANVPELFEKEWYLTSTQSSSITAWIQLFGYGTQGTNDKEAESLFRPVRRLFL